MNVYQGMRVKGKVVVTKNGHVLSPAKSLKVRRHSPAGFNWGYAGSGPAQLALAIMLEELPVGLAEALYQDFKAEVLCRLPAEWFILTSHEIGTWLATNREPLVHYARTRAEEARAEGVFPPEIVEVREDGE